MGVTMYAWRMFLRSLWYIVSIVTDFLFGLYYKGRHTPLPPITNSILTQSATSLAAQIRTQKLKSRDVVQAFIDRIIEVNPLLNAVVDQRFAEALEEADKVDEYLANKAANEDNLAKTKPFLGVPFTIKDSFQVRGLHQTVGMIRRKDHVSPGDADVIKLMKQAGAIPVAVTNVPELCFWMDAENNVYGRSRNPYDTTRITGGSSGGEGSIVASAGSVIGIGADIAGSIRNPSFMNGIFGHKPSAGSVPLDGQLCEMMTELNQFNTTGPMCRYASDLLPMMKVLSGPYANQLKLDTKVDIKKINFFYMTDDGGSCWSSAVDPEIKAAQLRVISYLEKFHGIKTKKVCMEKLKYSLEIWIKVIAKYAKASCSQEMTERNGEADPVVELTKCLFQCSSHTFPMILASLVEKYVVNLMSDEYVQMADDLRNEFQDLLGDNGVFLFPVYPRPAPYHRQNWIPPFDFFNYTCGFNILGFPSTQCPLGLSSNGLPLGIQVVATRYNDHLSLAVAQEIEKACGGWVPPSVVQI